MDPVPPRPRARSRRRTSLLASAIAAGLVVGGLTVSPGADTAADAVPPCTVPNFAGGAATAACPTPSSSTVPPTTAVPPPTTAPPPTTPPPGAITWSTSVEVLDRTGLPRVTNGPGLGLDTTLLGSWYNVDNTVATARTAVAWTAPTAFTPPNTRGSVGATSASIGPGRVQFRLAEQQFGFSGALCRSQLMPAIPTGPHITRVLVPRSTTYTADQLNSLIASLPGSTIRPDTSTSVTITAASLDPRPGILAIALEGRVHARGLIDYDGDFSYSLNLRVFPGSDPNDLRSVISVQAPQPGSLELDPNGLTDAVLQQFAGDQEPKFRQAVLGNARTTFNDAVSADPGVQFFRAMGYTASARAVTLTDDTLTVSPALCKFD